MATLSKRTSPALPKRTSPALPKRTSPALPKRTSPLPAFTAAVPASSPVGSSGQVPTASASTALTFTDKIHCAGMTYLYTSQGLVQATSFLISLSFLHINKGFSLTSLGLLGLPAYAFSFKFVWAPIVDLVWARSLLAPRDKSDGVIKFKGFSHRRLQWTVAVQVGICLAMWYLYHLATDTIDNPSDEEQAPASAWELIANNQRSVWDVVIALAVLCFLNATQDIAVDAWAVEGLHPKKASHAGTLQFVGLTVGMTMYSAFSNFHTSDSVAFPVSMYFLVAGIVALAGVLVAVLTAMLTPLYIGEGSFSAPGEEKKNTPSNADSPALSIETAKEIIAFLKTPTVINVVAYLLSRGTLESSNSLMGVELMSLNWTSTSNTATLSLIATVVQLLSATVITPFLLRKVEVKGSEDSTSASLSLMRRVIPINCSIHLFNFAFFAAVALTDTQASSTVQWWYLWGLQAPQMVLLSVIRSTVFVCVCTVFAKEASRVSNLTGTAVTILNSIANMGYALPASFIMLTSEWWMQVLLGQGASGATWATISGACSMAVGLCLLIWVTVPSLKRLEAAEKNTKSA